MHCNWAAAGVGLFGAIASALGQINTFHLAVSNNITPQYPTATIQVWATFDPAYYAFWKTKFDFIADDEQGNLTDPTILLMDAFGEPGSVSPDGASVDDADFFVTLQPSATGEGSGGRVPVAV